MAGMPQRHGPVLTVLRVQTCPCLSEQGLQLRWEMSSAHSGLICSPNPSFPGRNHLLCECSDAGWHSPASHCRSKTSPVLLPTSWQPEARPVTRLSLVVAPAQSFESRKCPKDTTVGQEKSPKDTHILIPGTCERYFIWQKRTRQMSLNSEF